MNSSVDNLFTLFHMFSWTLYYWQKNSTDTSLRIWKRFYPCNTYTVPSNKKNILYKYKPHIHSSYIFKQHRSLWVKINNIWLEYYKISFKKWQKWISECVTTCVFFVLVRWMTSTAWGQLREGSLMSCILLLVFLR